MMSEAQLRSIALFFYFAFQDEKLAEQASSKAIAKIQRRQKELGVDGVENNLEPIIVATTQRIWGTHKKHIRSTQSSVTYEGGWVVSKNVDLGPWRQFRKEMGEEEFLSVIWSQILNFSDDSISKGLGVTAGTVRHRVARGLKFLGSMVSGDVANG